jgi:hypothetical protein
MVEKPGVLDFLEQLGAIRDTHVWPMTNNRQARTSSRYSTTATRNLLLTWPWYLAPTGSKRLAGGDIAECGCVAWGKNCRAMPSSYHAPRAVLPAHTSRNRPSAALAHRRGRDLNRQRG